MSILAGKLIIYSLVCPRCGWNNCIYTEKVGLNMNMAILKAKVKANSIFTGKPKKCPECETKLKQVITPAIN